MTSVAAPHRSSDTAPRWSYPVSPARLPHLQAVEDALARIRSWTPYDGDAWLDDVADALDDVPPAEDAVGELVQRLRGYLIQLVNIAISREAEQRDARAAALVARACEVRDTEMPVDYSQAVVRLRRLGWAVNELHDLLVELRAVKGPDSLNENSRPAHPLKNAL